MDGSQPAAIRINEGNELMGLFERRNSRDGTDFVDSDITTRALSATAVENDFVANVYEHLASVYDLTYGPTLHPGRVKAIQRLGIQPGEHVLEVGVGTGINACLYPPEAVVTGVDFSASMLERARDRIARKGIGHVRLLEMDAADLKFGDNTFDVVYAAYLINCVPDALAVAREMKRVCRPGGRVVFLNHFRSSHPLLAWIDKILSPLTVHIGFKTDLDLPAFLAQAELKPVSIEQVSVPPIWSLVTCLKD
jgi:phosphatidylethanolamine/phosphatidyl-N-methylethanolamine N-methyltransferase